MKRRDTNSTRSSITRVQVWATNHWLDLRWREEQVNNTRIQWNSAGTWKGREISTGKSCIQESVRKRKMPNTRRVDRRSDVETLSGEKKGIPKIPAGHSLNVLQDGNNDSYPSYSLFLSRWQYKFRFCCLVLHDEGVTSGIQSLLENHQ